MNQEEKNVVMVACRRGNDKLTTGQSCDSRQAYKLSADGDRAVRFQCVKCKHHWIVGLGGSFNV